MYSRVEEPSASKAFENCICAMCSNAHRCSQHSHQGLAVIPKRKVLRCSEAVRTDLNGVHVHCLALVARQPQHNLLGGLCLHENKSNRKIAE
jgi:hypothetical protein